MDSHRRAKPNGAASKKARRNVRTIDCGVRGRFFPPRLASRPRPDRFRSLRPLEEAQAPDPGGSAAGALPSPTSSTSSSSDGKAAAAAPLPSAVQPSEAQPAAPPAAPRCKLCPWPRVPPPIALGVRDPQRPCVGQEGAALSLGLARPSDAPRAKRPCPPPAARPRHGRRGGRPR